MKKLLVIGLLLAVWVIAGPAIAANTLYVDDDWIVSGSCTAVAPNFCHPQDAVNAANPGDTIEVAEGHYGTRYSDCPWMPTCTCGDTNAPALIVYKDDLTIRATGSVSATIIESTHLCWSNPPAVQRSTNYAVNSIAAPNGVSIIADGVTIEGFTLRSLFAGDPYTNYPNTAGIMIGGLYAGDQTHLGVTGTTVRNCIILGHSGVYNWRASDSVIEGNTVRILGSDAHTPNTVNGNGVVVWDGWFEGLFPPTSTGVQVLNNDISTCNVETANGDEGKGIMFGGTQESGCGQWCPPDDPMDALGTDQSGMLIKGNTICAASSGIKFWNSLGTDKFIDCDNIITYHTYRIHDYGLDEGYPASTWLPGEYCQDGTGTPGYWMNHLEAWPVESITIGGTPYDKEDAIDLMFHSTKNDVTYIMFQSLVAAELNVLVGNDDSCIAETIATADTWMATNGPVGFGVKAGGKTSPWKTGEPLYWMLDDYNNGYLCAPYRSG